MPSIVNTYDGTESKSESCIAFVENAAQTSGQYILHIAFTKTGRSPFTSPYRLRDHLPHLTRKDLESELSREYSVIALNNHATQAFAHLQQGSNELLEMYLHHAHELLSKIIT